MLLLLASQVRTASLSDLLRSTSIRVEVTVVPDDTSDSATSSRPPRDHRTVGLGRPKTFEEKDCSCKNSFVNTVKAACCNHIIIRLM